MLVLVSKLGQRALLTLGSPDAGYVSMITRDLGNNELRR